MTTGVADCPSLETIGAFLDGRLADRERDAIAEHLSSCETCGFVFSEAARTRPASGTLAAETGWWISRRVMWTAASALAAAAAIVLAVNLLRPTPGVQPEQLITALATAVGPERTFEPRLTGGFAYGPVRGPVRAGEPSAVALSADVRIAVARIEKEASSRQQAELVRALAMTMLFGGKVDQAITVLEKLAGEYPDDAHVLNDLAAAYLIRADRTASAPDRSLALATVNRALEANRLLPEARFNRAYALERLGFTGEAREAWQAFLTIDDRSGWADEARARLRALTGQP